MEKLSLEVGTVVFDEAVQIEPGLELDGKLYSSLYHSIVCNHTARTYNYKLTGNSLYIVEFNLLWRKKAT